MKYCIDFFKYGMELYLEESAFGDIIPVVGDVVSLDERMHELPNNIEFLMIKIYARAVCENGDIGFLVKMQPDNTIETVQAWLTVMEEDGEFMFGKLGYHSTYALKRFKRERGRYKLWRLMIGAIPKLIIHYRHRRESKKADWPYKRA